MEDWSRFWLGSLKNSYSTFLRWWSSTFGWKVSSRPCQSLWIAHSRQFSRIYQRRYYWGLKSNEAYFWSRRTISIRYLFWQIQQPLPSRVRQTWHRRVWALFGLVRFARKQTWNFEQIGHFWCSSTLCGTTHIDLGKRERERESLLIGQSSPSPIDSCRELPNFAPPMMFQLVPFKIPCQDGLLPWLFLELLLYFLLLYLEFGDIPKWEKLESKERTSPTMRPANNSSTIRFNIRSNKMHFIQL